MLKPVVFSYYDLLDKDAKEEFIFTDDSAKVYLRKARLPKLKKGIRMSNWPLSLFNLNLIEKVWR